MKFYFNNQVFESLREAAKDYLQQICKQNEELRDNKTYYEDYSDIVDTDVSLEIYHLKDTNKYFFEVAAENVYTNSGNLLKMITDDSMESELIQTFEYYDWTKEVDAEDIDVDTEEEFILEYNYGGGYCFVDGDRYTFVDNWDAIKEILRLGAAYDDKLTYYDIIYNIGHNSSRISKEYLAKKINYSDEDRTYTDDSGEHEKIWSILDIYFCNAYYSNFYNRNIANFAYYNFDRSLDDDTIAELEKDIDKVREREATMEEIVAKWREREND